MGLSTPKQLSEHEHFHRPTDLCFLCGGGLEGDVWVYWQGNDERGVQIWMHPACAKVLGDHLHLDWMKFKREHPEKVWKQT